MKRINNLLNSKQIKDLSWGVKNRLEFIEFRLFWEERINRADITTFFNISIPQASADLSKYQELSPGNIVYDKSGKFYYASPDFKPIIITPSAEQYLLRYVAVMSGVLQKQRSFLGFLPAADTVPLPWRRIEPNILKVILRAIKYKKAIEIEYQSLSRYDKLMRWISPHALGFDGFRWHCRAYCHIDNFFKDFVLGRILGISDEKDSEVNPEDDKGWETYVTVKIGPNPDLEDGHRKIIEYEYGMVNGEVSIEVRNAMLFYLLNRLGLSAKKDESILQKQHLFLLNAEEVQKALEP